VAITKKGMATRQRIVEGAAAEIRARGVAITTLDDILAKTNTSKSQLFHYFPEGKDELLLAVARYEADQVLGDQQPQLGKLTSWRAWHEWRDLVVQRYLSQGERCPMNVLVAQLGRTNAGARAVVSELLTRWQSELAAGIQGMQSQGLISAELDVQQEAAALLAGVQGGVLVMLSTGRIGHLEAALDVAIHRLRTSVCGRDRQGPGTGR
jgi:AcrR family transcriptional regulator